LTTSISTNPSLILSSILPFSCNNIHHELILNWISTLFFAPFASTICSLWFSNRDQREQFFDLQTSLVSFHIKHLIYLFRPNLDKLFISLLHWCCGCFSGSLGDEGFGKSLRRLRSERSEWQRENGSLRGRRRQWIQSDRQNLHAEQFSLPKTVEQPASDAL
jgi:hypothetical protein